MMRRLFIPFLLCSIQFVFSEGYSPSAKFTIYEGLSASDITSLLISPDEFLWIATTNGLNRFDGYNFKTYTTDPSDTNTLPNDKIKIIQCDELGNIIGITSSSIFKIDKGRNSISSFSLNNEQKDLDKPYFISDMQIAGDKIYIVGDNFFGFVDLRSNTKKNFLDELKFNEYKLFNLNSVCIHEATSNLILNNTDQIFVFNPAGSSFQLIARSLTTDIRADGGILDIIPGSYNDCYVYTKYRIWKLDIQSDQYKLIFESKKERQNPIIKISLDKKGHLRILTNRKVIDYNLYKSVSSDEFEFELGQVHKYDISSFIFDNAGILWIGTDKGLFKFNPHKNIFKTIYGNDFSKSGGTDKIGWAGFIDNNSGLAFMQSGSIIKFKGYQKEKITDLTLFKTIDTKINSVVSNEKGEFLICTKNGFLIWKGYIAGNSRFSVEEKQFSGNEIYAACFDPSDSIWFAGKSAIYKANLGKNPPVEITSLSRWLENMTVKSMVCSDEYLWIQGNHRIVEYNLKSGGIYLVSFFDHAWPIIHSVLSVKKDELFIGTSDGLYQYTANDRKIKPLNPAYRLYNACIFSLEKTSNNKIWASTDRGLILFDPETGKERLYDASDGLPFDRFKEQFSAISKDGFLLFGGSDGIVYYHPDSITINKHVPNVEITQITYFDRKGTKSILSDFADTIEINFFKNHVRINFAVLDFWAPEKNYFLYSLVEHNESQDWQNIKGQNFIDINALKPGYYTLSIKGMNNDGYWNEESKAIVVRIIQPFWRSKLAYLIYIFILAGLFYISVVFRTKHFRNLSRKFKEREFASKQIQFQKDELSVKNKNITDSLNYAKRIQMAMMPPQKLFRKLFNDSFILHISKDIVSGDFYWVNEVEDRIYFAAVDCTGHGVPGAFMSIIGFELLRRITETDKKKQPAIILDNLSLGFEKIFRDIENFTLRDGMDVAFCAIDKEMRVLEFAGAFNPLYLIRDNTITEIKGDRFSVGLNVEGVENRFKNNVLQLNKGDIIYIFTDGFADQFGGPEGKKYKYRRFRHLLLALHQLPMERQAEFLKRSINDWRGDLDQVDDILVMGIRIN